MKQYNIKEYYKRGNIWEHVVIQVTENDVIRILEIHTNKKYEDEIPDIIKIDLPSDEKEALEILHNGKELDGIEYVTLATTSGLMKKASLEDDSEGEVFFIKKELEDFKQVFEDVISLGKLKEKEDNKLCINKDAVSRISLAFSDGQRVHLPGLKKAILPEMTYTYVNNYLQFAEKTSIDDNNNLIQVIDIENLTLEPHPNEEVDHVAMDGSGFILPDTIEEIRRQLDVKYPLSWVGIREIGVASKGLLVKFDFKKYLKEECNLDKLIVKDMWGHDIDLFEVDVILNSSMVKWGKWNNSKEEIQDLINQDKYTPYKDLFEGFNIVKYNKKEPKAYTESNYQIITNLNLTPNELSQLSRGTRDGYERVINKEVDATRIALGDIARDESNVLSASTKMHKLIQLEPSLINIQSAHKISESLVNKKVNQFAGGNIHLKGNYKVILKDAISYFDSLVKQDYTYYKDGKLKGIQGHQSDRGLKDTNYVPGELGLRTLARCPLNTATELVKTELVSNKLYDKYFSDLSSDICFFSFNDAMAKMSGADEDLDIAFVIDNDTIYNAVIDDIDENGTKWYFRNQFDGGAKEEIYNLDNLYKSIVENRGNAIGELSNKGAIISNLIQELPYKRPLDGKLNSYENMLKIDSKEAVKNTIRKYLDEEIIVDYKKITDDEIRKFILNNFQEYKLYSYFTLYLQMKAIDSAKTGIPVTPEENNKLGEITKGKRKPLYIYYAKYKSENKTVKYKDVVYSNSLLNNHCKEVISDLGYKAREIKKDYSNKSLYKILDNINDDELNEDLLENLSKLNAKYHNLRDRVPANKEIRLIRDRMKMVKDNEARYMSLRERLQPLIQEQSNEYDKIDILIYEEYQAIKEGYTNKQILKALSKVRNNGNRVSSRFILEFCFEELDKYLLELKLGELETYVPDSEGEISYIHQNYKKVITGNVCDKNLIKEQILKKEIRQGLVKKFGIKNPTHNTLTSEITITGKKVYNSNNELLGLLFKKSYCSDGNYTVRESKETDKSIQLTVEV